MKVTQTELAAIADAINAGDLPAARALISARLALPLGDHWRRDFTKLVAIIDDSRARFTVIARGNVKLGDKFLTWSTLPATTAGGIGCPGAGECVAFCYSRKAWRYPAAFCRQAQNTILLQSAAGREQIAASLDKQHKAGYSIFRLYVDGDFSARPAVAGFDDFQWWMKTLTERPTIISYGYSKSFSIILMNSSRVPGNYTFNVSSGHNASAAVVAAARLDPSARGDFTAVTDVRVPAAGHSAPGHRQALVKHYKAATGRKAFACPGTCHTCTPKHGHACASPKFNNVDIIIAAH